MDRRSPTSGGRRRRGRYLSPLVIIAMLVASLAVAAAPVAAASQTKTAAVSVSGGTDVDVSYGFTGTCDECVPDDLAGILTGQSSWSFAFGADVTTAVDRLDWSSTGSIDVTYDDALLRQGQTLSLRDTLTTTGGTIHATGTLSGNYGLFVDPAGGTDFVASNSTKSFAKDVTWDFACVVPLPGESPRTCTSGAQTVDIDDYTLFTVPLVIPVDLLIELKASVALTVTVDSDGIVAVRKLEVVGGGSSQDADLSWTGSSPSTLVDTQALSCTQPAGNEVRYRFTGLGVDAPGASLAARSALTATAVASPEIGPDIELYGPQEFASKTSTPSTLDLALSGADTEVTLGTLAKNNVPPIAHAGGGADHAYAGDQGTPITFDGSGSSSVCGFPTLRWDFSDGGVAFGKSPQHTFQGSGTYSGQLTATDATGLTSSTTFSIVVANLAPVVSAGPDTTAAWGRQVTFNGSATDPGDDDQSTLRYAWSFGDGSPSATGGPSVQHAYASPGSYTATLTVCDRRDSCASDTRTVTVRTRTVSLGSLGDTAAIYDTGASRHAALVDEFGSVVNGRTVSFSVAGATVGSSVTNSSGIAGFAWTPLLDAGSYSAGASFAGDSLYAPAEANDSVNVSRKASAVTYTGPLTGGPNKAVTLSAVLKDATGKALGGRTIQFRLGSQTVNASTNATGVATAQLKLSQKNGTYQLTATWAPAGADAARYDGSAASATFKLQAR